VQYEQRLQKLIGASSTAASENELVLLVTPQLVHPLEPNELPALPGSDYFEPGDLEFYLQTHGLLWAPFPEEFHVGQLASA